MPHEIEVTTASSAWDGIPRLRKTLADMIESTLDYLGLGSHKGYKLSVNCLLTDDEALRQLNHDFRGMNKPTNVLSFPAYDGDLAEHPLLTQKNVFHLGDMALAYETIKKESERDKQKLSDHAAHMVVHGTLHLMGFDHEDDDQAELMEFYETKVLEQFGIRNPYE